MRKSGTKGDSAEDGHDETRAANTPKASPHDFTPAASASDVSRQDSTPATSASDPSRRESTPATSAPDANRPDSKSAKHAPDANRPDSKPARHAPDANRPDSKPARHAPDASLRRSILAALALLAAALVPRLIFLHRWPENFDSDEALIGVQAAQILHGHFGLFLPGQSYMGSLQSLFAAPFLALFGPSATATRISPLLWILPGLLALLALERLGAGFRARGAAQSGSPLARGRGAWLLSLFWAFPPAVLFLAGVKARGGNLEGIVLGLWSMALLWPAGSVRASTASGPGGSRKTEDGRGAALAGAPAGGPDGGRKTEDGRRAALASAPSSPLRVGRRALRWALGGVLLGLAAWTHDEAFILVPLALVLVAAEGRLWWRKGALLALGFAAGYLPLWIPRLAPFGLGPPGTEGSGWTPVISALGHPRIVIDGLRAFAAALLAGGRPSGIARVLQILGVVAFAAFCLAGIRSWIRTSRSHAEAGFPGFGRWQRWARFLGASPAFTVTLWLAAGTLGALLVSPQYLADEQWFRYTLGLAPAIVVASAWGALSLSPRASAVAAAGLALLSWNAAARAVPAWPYPWSALRPALARELAGSGRNRIETDWELAYVLRFLSRDSLLCACETPPRFPEVNARVDFSSQVWTVQSAPPPGPDRGGGSGTPEVPAGRAARSLAEAFSIFPRSDSTPPEVVREFAALDLSRTLFAWTEPFPLLEPGEFRRDWRGWPYRRSLREFSAIVWDPGEGADPGKAAILQSRLDALVSRKEFVVTAQWNGRRILRRFAR